MNEKIETKDESDFLTLIPRLFESQEEGFKLFLMEKNTNGQIGVKQIQNFESFMDLERETWNIDYTKSYLAFMKDKNLSQITFSGQIQVISFKVQDGKPKLVFYKNKGTKPASEIIYQKDKDDIIDAFEEILSNKAS
jgi:hypothetical protein